MLSQGGASTSSELEKARRQKMTDLKKILSAIKDLNEELESQRKHVEKIRKMILEMKDSLFPSVTVDADGNVNTAGASEEVVQVFLKLLNSSVFLRAW